MTASMPGTLARPAITGTPRIVAYGYQARVYPWAVRRLALAEAVHGAPVPAPRGRPRKRPEAPREAGVQDLARRQDGLVAVGMLAVLAAGEGSPVRPGRLAEDRDSQPAAPSPGPVLPSPVGDAEPARCEKCAYLITAPGHRAECGETP